MNDDELELISCAVVSEYSSRVNCEHMQLCKTEFNSSSLWTWFEIKTNSHTTMVIS